MTHDLGPADLLAPGESREFVAGPRIVALFRVGDDYHALDGMCPHAGGPLAEGTLDGCRVTCPWHGWQFDVTTGTHQLTPEIVHERFPVTVASGRVVVEIPDDA